MRTIEDIINFSLNKAGRMDKEASEMTQELKIYDIYLRDLLEERNWVWSFGTTRSVTQTEDGNDLGFKYRYRIGADAEEVVAINFGSNIGLAGLSIHESLRAGYAIDPIGEPEGIPGDNSFVFINGVLHSNSEVTSVIFKKIPDPVEMPTPFKILLAWKMATHFVIEPGGDRDRQDTINSELRKAHLRACRFETRKPTDPQLLEVYNYVKTLRTETYLRY